MKKHGDAFALYRLPGSYGCLIFNKSVHAYCLRQNATGTEVSLPDQREVVRIFKEIRFLGANTPKGNQGQTRFGKLVAWFSKKLNGLKHSKPAENSRVAVSALNFTAENRRFVVPRKRNSACFKRKTKLAKGEKAFSPFSRLYISPPKNWKNCKLDCKGNGYIPAPAKMRNHGRPGESAPVDLTEIGKDWFDHEEPRRKFNI